MNVPVYVYDSNDMSKPLFVVYDPSHVAPVVDAVFSHVKERIYVSTIVEHAYDRSPYYVKTSSKKPKRRDRVRWR